MRFAHAHVFAVVQQVHVALVRPRRLHLVVVVVLVVGGVVHLVAHVRGSAARRPQILHVGGCVALVLHGLLVRHLVARVRLALKVQMVEVQQPGRGFLNGGGQAVGGVEHRARRNRGARVRVCAQVADDVLLARRAHHFQQRRHRGANGAEHAPRCHRAGGRAAVVVQHLVAQPPVVGHGRGLLARRRHVHGVVLAGVNMLPLGRLHRGSGVRGRAVLLRARAEVLRRGGGAVDEAVGLNGARGLRLLQPRGGQPAVRRVQVVRVRQVLLHLALRGGGGRVRNVVIRRPLVRFQAERELGVRLHAQLVHVAVHPLLARVHAGIEAAAAVRGVALVQTRGHAHLLPRLHVGNLAGRHLARLHEVAGVRRPVDVVVVLLRLEQRRHLRLADPLRPRAVHGVQHGLLRVGVGGAAADFGAEEGRHVVVLKFGGVHGLAGQRHDLAALLVGVSELRLAAETGTAVGHAGVRRLVVVLVGGGVGVRERGVRVCVVARIGLEHGVVVGGDGHVGHGVHGTAHVGVALRCRTRSR